jgi:GTP-binding protein HflX
LAFLLQFLTLLHACRLASPNPRTYIGSGKVAEIKTAIHALDVETVIFDDELSAG